MLLFGMGRALILAALFAVLPGASSGQALGVLRIKVTLTNAAQTPVAVPRHALLISDNPNTSTPRRVVTNDAGTAEVRLPPGNYTVESDEPFNFEGKSYQWTETLDVRAGRDVALELTSRNAAAGAPVAPPREIVSSSSVVRWQDSVVTVWTPLARGPGVIIDAEGLVVTNERVVGSATAVKVQVEVQLTPSVKVAARVLASDHDRDVAVLWIDPATAAAVRPVPPECAGARKDLEFARIAPVGDVCEVIRSAETMKEKLKETAQAPAATRLPVEPPQTLSADALDEAVKRRAGSLNPYQVSSSDFDIAFLTPLQFKGAKNMDFGAWSDYFADAPQVLAVRVTPKMAEGFWTKVARGAAYTQGAVLPPIKHFKPGFLRMQAFCGDVEVTPIHPFILERRVSETDATREGLYVFDPEALGPHCKSVKLVVYSEKDPQKADSKTVDPRALRREN